MLEAAYLSFAELTYAGATIDHIVRRAEVNRSTFYDEAEIEEWVGNLLIFYRANKPLYLTLGQIPALEPEGARWEEDVRREIGIRLGGRIPAFRRATSPTESTPQLRIRFMMTMMQFETGVFYLAFRDHGPDRQALMDFTVRTLRRFIVEEAVDR